MTQLQLSMDNTFRYSYWSMSLTTSCMLQIKCLKFLPLLQSFYLFVIFAMITIAAFNFMLIHFIFKTEYQGKSYTQARVGMNCIQFWLPSIPLIDHLSYYCFS